MVVWICVFLDHHSAQIQKWQIKAHWHQCIRCIQAKACLLGTFLCRIPDHGAFFARYVSPYLGFWPKKTPYVRPSRHSKVGHKNYAEYIFLVEADSSCNIQTSDFVSNSSLLRFLLRIYSHCGNYWAYVGLDNVISLHITECSFFPCSVLLYFTTLAAIVFWYILSRELLSTN